MVTRPPTGTIPDTPGSYQFKDALGRVIYVGKASSLRQRLSNYFQDPRNLHPRTAQMVATAESVEWIEVRNEVEALMLEWTLIKQHRPRFNIRLRDDKSYPFLAVTVDEQFPRALVMRGRKRKGTRYFGPYAHAYAIRDTLDLLLRSFPIRTCSPGKFNEHQRLGRPCLLFHIEKCSGPCVGEIERARLPRSWSTSCATSSTATPTRSSSASARRCAPRPTTWSTSGRRASATGWPPCSGRSRSSRWSPSATRTSTSSVSPTTSSRPPCRCSTSARVGSSVARASCVDKVEELSPGGLVDRIIEELYGDEPPLGVPKQVLVPVEPEDVDDVRGVADADARLAGADPRAANAATSATLHETVTRNAKEEFVRHRLRRAGDHNARSRALTELQDLLALPEAPLRIECYDMAHLQGSDYVGSMVVLEDGLPNKREYRRFKVRDVPGNDDYAAMEEVLDPPPDGLPRRARPATRRELGQRPGEVLRTHRSCCSSTAARGSSPSPSGWSDRSAWPTRSRSPHWPSASKRSTCRVGSEPVEVPRGSEALFMLQRIRDEAHRFANTFHRELRGKRMTTSSLDGIAGLGEARKKKLVQVMGGVNAVKKASLDELQGAVLPARCRRRSGLRQVPPVTLVGTGVRSLCSLSPLPPCGSSLALPSPPRLEPLVSQPL